MCGERALGATARAARQAAALRRLLGDASAFGEVGGAGELQWATAAYAAGRAPPAERADPRRHAVLLFPGRGAARVGMGRALRDLPAARRLYDLASAVLGWDVWRTCTEGPGGSLAARAEPAVLVTALAALERARAERPAALQRVRAAAGPGAGELAALVFAGSLSLEAALLLAEARAAVPGAALELRLAPDARLPELLRAARAHAAERGVREPVCALAGYLGPARRVLAGHEEALRWVEARGAALGARGARRLAAAPALHCALARPAAAAAREALAGRVRAPRLPVLSCWSGRALRGAAQAERALWAGAAAPLLWEQALQTLYARPPGTPFPLTLALVDAGLLADLRRVNARAADAAVLVPA